MSATMARKGSQVQLEQSDRHLALNIANVAWCRFSRAGIEETQYLIRSPYAKV